MTIILASEKALSQEFTGLVGALSELDPTDAEFELITADPAEDLEHAYGIAPAGPQASSCCCCCSPCCSSC
jgi:hypothetical protein